MIHKIENNTDKWFCSLDPFSSFYKIDHSPENFETLSGALFMITDDTKQGVIDLVFSDYEEIEPDEEAKNDKGHINLTAHQIDFSVGYTQAEAQATIDAVRTTGFIFLNYIKHPDREEYAIPFQNVVFSAIPAGPLKDQLEAQAALINSQGRRKTIEEIVNDGWV